MSAQQRTMRFLHTADWHLGRMLYGRKRYAEHTAFLDWLAETISANQVDVLLVPGDIFDTRSPSNLAQQLYYDFLLEVSKSTCRHVVITSGNHDSPSFLDAPKSVLRAVNTHVVGQAGDIADELITLTDPEGNPEALICAVPYLRDRDLRTAEIGETSLDKEQKIITGIQHHYAELAELAEQKQKELPDKVPIIAMGHLFASGGKMGDGVRDLYVGNLGSVSAETFSPLFDYVALGHIHIAQRIGKKNHIRYSGSPIPMGFGELENRKEVLLVDIDSDLKITPIEVPCFQPLLRIAGDLEELLDRLSRLKAKQSNAWLEIDYTGKEEHLDLKNQLYDAIEESDIEIRLIKNSTKLKAIKNKPLDTREILEQLSPSDVFERCLNNHEVPENERDELIASFEEILTEYHESDAQAE